jgi:hypothetical protein
MDNVQNGIDILVYHRHKRIDLIYVVVSVYCRA